MFQRRIFWALDHLNLAGAREKGGGAFIPPLSLAAFRGVGRWILWHSNTRNPTNYYGGCILLPCNKGVGLIYPLALIFKMGRDGSPRVVTPHHWEGWWGGRRRTLLEGIRESIHHISFMNKKKSDREVLTIKVAKLRDNTRLSTNQINFIVLPFAYQIPCIMTNSSFSTAKSVPSQISNVVYIWIVSILDY